MAIYENNKKNVEQVDSRIEYTDTKGNVHENETSTTIAKKTIFESGTKYFIKCHRNTRKLFNLRTSSFKERKTGGQPETWVYKTVSPRNYKYYLDYIETGNDYSYNQASVDYLG